MEHGTFFNRAPQPRVAGIWGEESVWETRERASRSGRKSCSGETLPTHGRPRDSHGEGFQHPLEIERCGGEAGAFLEKKRVGLG